MTFTPDTTVIPDMTDISLNPGKAGIREALVPPAAYWIPAFAGMTIREAGMKLWEPGVTLWEAGVTLWEAGTDRADGCPLADTPQAMGG